MKRTTNTAHYSTVKVEYFFSFFFVRKNLLFFMQGTFKKDLRGQEQREVAENRTYSECQHCKFGRIRTGVGKVKENDKKANVFFECPQHKKDPYLFVHCELLFQVVYDIMSDPTYFYIKNINDIYECSVVLPIILHILQEKSKIPLYYTSTRKPYSRNIIFQFRD